VAVLSILLVRAQNHNGNADRQLVDHRASRDTYFDALRLLALLRVVLYHLTYTGWLAVAFPSMGVMFAIAGYFTAQSIERRGLRTIANRLGRVLPALWTLGAVIVPLSLIGALGFGAPATLTISGILSWVFPFADPTGLHAIDAAWRPLWYLRAYVWFLLLSPLVVLLARRIPFKLIAAAVIASVVAPQTLVQNLHDAGPLGPVPVDLLTYGSCWLIGMVAHTGALQRVPVAVYASIATLLAASGMWVLLHHAAVAGRFELYGAPVFANTLWSCAWVLVILRFRPGARHLARVPSASRPLRWLSGRALTIYLWHGLAIVTVGMVLNRPEVQPLVKASWTPASSVWMLVGTFGALAAVTCVAGRVEQRPRLLRTAGAQFNR
jgi:peptidoglycan/LPS O-acetylase OafA/YrhL